MPFFSKKKIAVILLVFLLIFVVFAIYQAGKKTQEQQEEPESEIQAFQPKIKTIGYSVENREIIAHTFTPKPAGQKETAHLVFVGGIHGGYEYNSVVLAYKAIDYFTANPNQIPPNLTLTIIPNANPDGIYKVIKKEGRFNLQDAPAESETIAGRFNANNVDLNRNFDCKWQSESTWRSNKVSAGTQAFSEPETRAIRSFVLENKPSAVIFYHSQANAVYASECENGILPKTLDITNIYAKAANYNAIESFDSYEITGDAEGWLASINIPAITVELKTHTEIEWEQNLAGIKALFEYYQ